MPFERDYSLDLVTCWPLVGWAVAHSGGVVINVPKKGKWPHELILNITRLYCLRVSPLLVPCNLDCCQSDRQSTSFSTSMVPSHDMPKRRHWKKLFLFKH